MFRNSFATSVIAARVDVLFMVKHGSMPHGLPLQATMQHNLLGANTQIMRL